MFKNIKIFVIMKWNRVDIMKNKRIIILCITAIVLIVTGLLYFSYGYYMTNITGTENSKKLTSLTKIFKFEFSDGTEKLVSSNTNFIPGSVIEKTFTITNKSTEGVYFNIDLDEVTNTFSRTSDIIYEVYYNNEIISTNTFPTTNASIATNLYIEKDGTRTYTLKVKYLNSEENQISDMGKSISANLSFSRTDSPITKFNILGNSYQAIGTGKNLLDINSDFQAERITNSISYPAYKTVNGNNVTVSANGSATSRYSGWIIPCQDISTITVSFDLLTTINNTGNFVIVGLTEGTTTIPTISTWGTTLYSTTASVVTKATKTFDVGSYNYIGIGFSVVGTNQIKIKRLQVEEGSSSTTYEKYGISPTPDNPSEITSLGTLITDSNDENYDKYKVEIKSVGTNMFDYDNVSQASHISKKTFSSTLEDGSVLEEKGYYVKGYNAIYISTYETLQNYIGKTVTVSFDLITGEDGDFLVYPYQNNGIGIRFASKKISVKANETTRVEATGIVTVLGTVPNYSRGQIIVYKNGYTNTYTVKNVQFEFGDKATDYEPYEEKNYDAYLSEPLRCVGDTCDYIDLVNKKVVRKIKRSKISELNFVVYTDLNKYHRFEALVNDKYFTETYSKNIMSNVLATSQYNIFENNSISERNNLNTLRILTTTYSTIDELNNAIGSQLIEYVLATPKEENISLPDISEFNGKTLIVSDGNMYSSKIEKE